MLFQMVSQNDGGKLLNGHFVFWPCLTLTVKKAECRRIDAFELWCWRRLLRVSSTARRSNQSILKEISPEYSSEGLMMKLKLKLQYFVYLMGRTDSLEKTLMLGKTEGGRRRKWQRMKWLDSINHHVHRLNGHELSQTLVDSEGQGGLTCCSPWGLQRVGHD